MKKMYTQYKPHRLPVRKLLRLDSSFLALLFCWLLMPSCNYVSEKMPKNLDLSTKLAGEHKKDKDKKGDTTLPSTQAALDELKAYESGNYKYTVEDFYRKPARTYYKLSPNGEYLAYLGRYERRLNLFIQKIGSNESLRITNSLDRDLPYFFWANNNRLLYVKDNKGNENYNLYAVDRDGGNPKDLTPFEEVRIRVIDELENLEDEIIIGMNKNNPRLYEPFRLNIVTGKLKQLAKNEDILFPYEDWKTDHEGKLRLVNRISNGTDVEMLYRKDENSPWKVSIKTDWKESIYPLFFDFNNPNIIYASTNLNRDKNEIVRFDLAQGKVIETVFEHPGVDVFYATYSKKRKVPTTVYYVTDRSEYAFLDKEVEDLYQRFCEELSHYEIFITAADREENKFILRTYSDRSMGAYYLYDKIQDSLTKIADVSPWIQEGDLANMQPISYKARDGWTIHGYLTLPNIEHPKNLPAIIWPHGGPHSRIKWGYSSTIQMLANRGYAVFQMNFRGSTGYGKKFKEAGHKEWGGKIQEDISDGARWLVAQGIADSTRLGLYGGSFGGYSCLMQLATESDLYSCGVDYVGTSSLFTLLENIPPYWEPYKKMLHETVGNPAIDSLEMRDWSPLFLADEIEKPLFVVQGANDVRVKIIESDQIVEALRGKGMDVPYMVKYDEGHGFVKEENRYDFYETMLGFFAKHLKADEGTTAKAN